VPALARGEAAPAPREARGPLHSGTLAAWDEGQDRARTPGRRAQSEELESMAEPKPLVGILMESKSDWEVMKSASETLKHFAIAHECRVLSAHRTPAATIEYVSAAES